MDKEYFFYREEQAVPEGLDREGIYEALRERTPYIARRNATRRIFEESGVNLLLDQLIIIQQAEDDFERVFGVEFPRLPERTHDGSVQ